MNPDVRPKMSWQDIATVALGIAAFVVGVFVPAAQTPLWIAGGTLIGKGSPQTSSWLFPATGAAGAIREANAKEKGIR
jgi:hypothetical protein